MPVALLLHNCTFVNAGLFAQEEQQLLLEQLRPWLVTQPELRPGRGAAWEAFIHRARHHLHIVFATSPVGEAFRKRCRQFPSLVNCMTVDWYHPWPAAALFGVGVRFLGDLSLQQGQLGQAAAGVAVDAVQTSPGSTLAPRVAQLCVQMHKDVEQAAKRLHQDHRRRCVAY